VNTFLFFCSLVGAAVLVYLGVSEAEWRAAALSGAAVLGLCVLRG